MLDGSVLKRLRKRSGLTLDGVGGINATHLSQIECERKVPKLDTLERILGAYGFRLRVVAYKPGADSELTYDLLT